MTTKVKITTEVRPFFNGCASEMGSEIIVTEAEASLIIENGWGEITGKAKTEKKVRARKNGKFVADDPNTDINEAWVDGS